MGPEARVRIVHFADPWCWWSWGLEPALQRLREVYGDRLEVDYRMGGTFGDVTEWMRAYGVDEDSTKRLTKTFGTESVVLATEKPA